MKRCPPQSMLAGVCLLACTAANPAYHVDPVNDDAASAELLPDAAPRSRPRTDAAVDASAAPLDLGAPDELVVAADAPAALVAVDASPDRPRGAALTSSGLVAYWRLDPAGGDVVVDDVGGNDGTLQGGAALLAAPPTTAKFDDPAALLLDGVNGYVELGVKTLPAMNKPKSICAWFWIAASPAGRKDLVALANPDQSASLQIGLDGGALAIWTWNEFGDDAKSTVKPAPGWHHFVYTYDGATQALYLDGTRAASTAAAPFDLAVTRAYLGAFDPTNGATERFGGRMDDVRVYNRALKASEISALAAGDP